MKQNELQRIVLLFSVCFFSITIGFSQSKTVNGAVKSANDNMPLPGVSIIIKGTNIGTTTDFDGNYSMKIEDNESILVFSYLGYSTKEIIVGQNSLINILLDVDQTTLDEVVVVGYGTTKKAFLTSSVSSIKSDEVSSMAVPNASNALSGRVPGLITAQTSGAVGSDQTSIRIRGISTTGNSSPLIVIDGVQRNNLNELDMNNVESYSVLKDAAAVSMFGIAGANGVILITTKSGKSGKAKINYNAWTGWQNPTQLTKYANSYQLASAVNQAEINDGIDIASRTYSADDLETYRNLVNGNIAGIDQNIYANANAADFILRDNAPISNHHLDVSGGTDKSNYYIGMNYLDQGGLYSATNLKRLGLSTKFGIDLGSKTKLNLSINGWNENFDKPTSSADGIFNSIQAWLPTEPINYTNGLLAASSTGLVLPDRVNKGDHQRKTNNLLTQLRLKHNILPSLSIEGRVSYDHTARRNKNWNEPGSIYYQINQNDDPYTFDEIENPGTWSLSEQYFESNRYSFQGLINYDKVLGDHSISFTGLAESLYVESETFGASRDQFELPIPILNLGTPDKEQQSNFGSSNEASQVGFAYRLAYSYQSKYLLEGSARYDGHYYFAPGNRWGFFPSMAIGWRISKEPFLSSVSFIDNLKLRASVGESGALAGGPNQFSSALILYGDSYPIGGQATQGLYASSEANPDITWERATKYDVGLDFSFFDGLIDGQVDYFYEKRDNMLVNPGASVPVEYGIGLGQVNAGRMQNRGIELSLGSTKSFSNGLEANLNVTFTYTRNELLETFENEATRDDPNRSRTRNPLNSIFGLEAIGLFTEADDINNDGVINSDDGFPVQNLGGIIRPGNIRYADVNGDGVIDLTDEKKIGFSPFPEIIYGINGGFKWKGFDLNYLFQGTGNSNM